MDKEEYIKLLGENYDQAELTAKEMAPKDLVSLLDDFSKTGIAGRTDDFMVAEDILIQARLDKIKSLRDNVSSLSVSELEGLETLIGDAKSASDIEGLSSLRDQIADRKKELADQSVISEKSPQKEGEENAEPKTTENPEIEPKLEEDNADKEPSKEDIEKAIDERYGIDDEHLQSPEKVTENIRSLARMPKNDVLLKDPEFEKIRGVFDQIEIKNEKDKPVKQKGEQSDIALFKEQVRNETEMWLANTSKEPITPEVFKSEYATRLQVSFLELLGTDAVSKKVPNISKEEAKESFSKVYSDLYNGEKLSLNQSSFIGWQAARQASSEKAVGKLSQKEGYSGVAKTFKESIKATDKKLDEKYGKVYRKAKGLLKTALTAGGWSAAYAAGAAIGPAGIAAVATVKLADSTVKMVKTYKKQKAEAKEKGEKYGLKQFISKRDNRMQLYGAALTAAGGYFGFAGTERMLAGVGLAAIPTVDGMKKAWKNTQGPWYKKAVASAKVLGSSALGFGAGMLAGSAVGGAFHGHTPSVDNHASQATDSSSYNEGQPTSEATDYNFTKSEYNLYDANQPQAETVPQDANVDVNAPDPQVALHDMVNNLSDEQAHDLKMLFLRDPREANQILGQSGQDWMNSNELQQAWDNGTITDAQKAELLDFSHQRFDAKGHYQDIDGYASAESMEAAAHASHPNANAESQTSENTVTDNSKAEQTVTPVEPEYKIGDVSVSKAQYDNFQMMSGILNDVYAKSGLTLDQMLAGQEAQNVGQGTDNMQVTPENTNVNTAGNLPTQEGNIEDGKEDHYSKYDDEGNLKETVEKIGDWTKSERYNDGKLISQEFYDEKGRLNTAIGYDGNGNEIRRVFYNEGQLSSIVNFDENHNITNYEKYEDGFLGGVSEHLQFKDGKVINQFSKENPSAEVNKGDNALADRVAELRGTAQKTSSTPVRPTTLDMKINTQSNGGRE